MQKEKAYEAGWKANKEGAPFDANPYNVFHSLANGVWSNGWLEAQADALRKDALLTYDLTQIPIDNTAHQFESLAEKKVEWNGKGLPPVGCECEVKRALNWQACSVEYISDMHAVLTIVGAEVCWQTSACQFRRIRTEEEKKREETIADLQNALGHAHGLFDLVLLYKVLTSGNIRHIKLES